jgi:hypothetical protein
MHPDAARGLHGCSGVRLCCFIDATFPQAALLRLEAAGSFQILYHFGCHVRRIFEESIIHAGDRLPRRWTCGEAARETVSDTVSTVLKPYLQQNSQEKSSRRKVSMTIETLEPGFPLWRIKIG